MSEHVRFRDLKIDEQVSVTLPAHIWLGFIASYSAFSDYNCGYANMIGSAAQEAMLDPVYLRERQAETERQLAQHQHMMSNMIPGFPGPQIPPDLSGLEDTGEDK